ncbi:helix-turn-helix domain-containing protein [Ezakiella peruensis]|uniref:helix-turn-helix domain-containing protein n=1 Tax=Ezakiella peruensis TaxID=1464038 RepID=UPI001473474C|nr:helix-turn-helix domain-containing protein [Ezakiella peruensis]
MDYTKDYKKKKVEEYLNSKLSLRKFVKINNIPKTTLQGWIQTYNEYGPDAFMDSTTT